MAIVTLTSNETGANSLIDINANFVDLDTTKADLASPTFTGTPALPTGTTGVTQSASDNSTKLATTAYVDNVTRSCLTLIPKSPIPWDDGSDATSAATVATNTTANVGQVIIPFQITVNKLSIRTGTTVTTPGTFDIVLYSENGQTKIIDVTTDTISAINTIYTTTVSAVSVPPGVYYILIVPNGTASATIHHWQSQPNAAFGVTAGLGEDVSGEPVIQGTLTVTASTPPTTFTPSSITGAAQNVTLAFRLDN